MSKKIMFKCDKCGSTNVKGKQELYDKKYETHKDYDTLDYDVTELVSYKTRYNCKCLDCGYSFNEY